ncbi:GNAT family N-acetyltransferase [uncultured Chryseobacterium sp.]|uniref:GNAT family N-acetyltransferase n=1 Tax=uncultured Chryseobacterium sp. TaxID=259322 RepID=UPI0025FFD969|nr:GNAT family N-acetyltransferase [uncultured Chryseobacterium sp.]
MMSVMITQASSDDLETIQQTGRQTFSETFSESNEEEEMKRYLDESFATEKVQSELSNPDSLFFIAWDEGQPIGYLKLNSGTAQTELQDDTALEIERIYVKNSHQGKKIGQLLYNKAITVACELQKSYLWLGVWEENHKALSFYRKNGFSEFGKHVFRLSSQEQTDLMMKKPLE